MQTNKKRTPSKTRNVKVVKNDLIMPPLLLLGWSSLDIAPFSPTLTFSCIGFNLHWACETAIVILLFTFWEETLLIVHHGARHEKEARFTSFFWLRSGLFEFY